MKTTYSIEDFSAKNPVVTIGMFDGVHAGHRQILMQLNTAKNKIAGESTLITFWPHPRMFFGKTDNNFKILTPLDEKLELLEQAGLDNCVVLPFTEDFSKLSPEDFITEILHKGLGAKKVIIGYDHKFGYKGLGTFDLMKQYGDKLGFSVEKIDAFSIDQKIISSTKIRNYISSGDIETANRYLNYEYFIDGVVVSGLQIGRTIGFPTANIKQNSELKEIPANGVYAGRVSILSKEYKAVINIGNNPTINKNAETTIEVHILDFEGDLYSQNLRLFFVGRIRNEYRFESLEELKKAIQNDIAISRAIV